MDQEIQRRLMSTFLIKDFLKAEGNTPVKAIDQEIQRGLLSIFNIKYVLKA